MENQVEYFNDKNRPTAAQIVAKAKEYYAKEGNSVGGNLHIALEDGNLSTEHLCYCLELSTKKEDKDGIELSKMLINASKTQRLKVYNTLHFSVPTALDLKISMDIVKGVTQHQVTIVKPDDMTTDQYKKMQIGVKVDKPLEYNKSKEWKLKP